MDARKVIIIAGSGRSGTSWLHDVLTSLYNDYRQIFEPLHPGQVPGATQFAGLCLGAEDHNDALYQYLDAVFHGSAPKAWLRWMHMGISIETGFSRKAIQFLYNLPKLKFWATHRVVKFIQANLMLEWIGESFDYPIVFVIRNPYAVISSQLNMGWDHRVEHYTRQENVRKMLGESLTKFSESLVTIEQKLTARWCIENLIAIKQIDSLQRAGKSVIPVTYEKLQKDGNLDLMLRTLGYSDDDVVAVGLNMARREKWRSSRRKSTKGIGLSSERESRIKVVLDRFSMGSYKELTDGFDSIFVS